MYIKNNKGFTLIELLVVVAIISLLSSIVFASLNSARDKAKDAAVKAGVQQLANLMELNYNDYGSYCNLMPHVWIAASGVCSDFFSGTYATQAKQICTNIYNNAADAGYGAPGGYKILLGTNPASCSNSYSIEAYLSNGKWFCSGSSGARGEYATYYNGLGCYNNP